MIRKIFAVVLLILAALIVWKWPLISYGAAQGLGQAKIIWNAKPVDKILADPAFPDSLKAKLRLIQEIRRFAIDSLGLKDTENYKTVFDQKGKEIMWVVMACEPFRLKPHLWDFPVIGEVPYKGFFDKHKAVAEGKNLESEGLDVSIRNPGGWSTLGWFTDPILSKMLEHSEGDLASLIIHEMAHATIWVKDSVGLNENLASFVGDTAAYAFLKYKFGPASVRYIRYVDEDRNYRKYSAHMLRGATSLDSLYATMKDTEPVAEKRRAKEKLIRRIVDEMDTLSLHSGQRPRRHFSDRLPNNAYFMSFRHYESRQGDFKREMKQKFPGDLRGYIHFLAEKFPR